MPNQLPKVEVDTPPTAATAPVPRWLWIGMATLGIAVLLAAGQLWFLCDDAFITFRYVANAHAGHGLVWNEAPFAPVEGYSCFAWALVLWATWSWFGIEPPAAANAISLALGMVLYAVVAFAAVRVTMRDGTRMRSGVGLLTLITIAQNRTFLQWMTSGLETALFNLFTVSWVLWAFRNRRRPGHWLAVWSMLAAGAALTRPDGMLFVAATCAVAVLAAAQRSVSVRACALGLLPLLTIATHLLWRRVYYGEWLPNTYYAKVVAAWPEAGWHYLACFVAEHGSWWIAIVFVAFCLRVLMSTPRSWYRWPTQRTPELAAIAAILFQVGYYVLKVGGDHFEYRVFSHLVPLGGLATAAMAAWMTRSAIWQACLLGVLLLASSAGWVHYAATRNLPEHGFRPLHTVLPSSFAVATRWFDRHQAWLLFHNIGLRCEQHARILERFARPLPERADADAEPAREPLPVFAYAAVGLVSWRMPGIAILDHHGLNDWVVARTPTRAFGPPLNREALRPALQMANRNGDEWLDESELRGALAMISGGDGAGEAADFLVTVMLAVHSRKRADALSLAEAENIGDMLSRARSMAHERHPPVGYIEAFEPNVRLDNKQIVIQPRATPMTDERIRSIEAEWRARVREHRLDGK